MLPKRSQEMQFGAAEVHMATPHAAGHSAPVTMDAAHSNMRASLSLDDGAFGVHLVCMCGVLQMRWHLPPRALSRS